jgi:peptide-methionine (S)-S-oxide reductase
MNPLTRLTAFIIAATALIAVAWMTWSHAADESELIPAPALDPGRAPGALQTAVLAGGCFWGVQGVYQHVRGVRNVVSGYAGGDAATAKYDLVGRGRTAHAESVQVTFDPAEISYAEVLRIFFSVVHDPTQLNRQGPDMGPQYRSVIFYADGSQKGIAVAYVAQLEKSQVFNDPIVTRIDALAAFYPAEDYHQDFLINNPDNPYIVFHDLPKLADLKRWLPNYYRETPLTVKAAAQARSAGT